MQLKPFLTRRSHGWWWQIYFYDMPMWSAIRNKPTYGFSLSFNAATVDLSWEIDSGIELEIKPMRKWISSNKMLLITYHGGANYHRFIKNCLLEAIKLFFFILFAHFSTVISHFSFNKSPSLLFSTECIALCQRKNSSAFSPAAQQCCESIWA